MSSLQRKHNSRMGKSSRRNKSKGASLGTKAPPIRVVIDGPESNQLVRDISFPLTSTLNNNVYNIVASYESSAAATSSNTLPTFTAWATSLGLFDKASSYESVFDQYRIVMLEYTWLPGSNTVVSGGNAGMFSTVIDYDDDTALTTTAQALDYASCLSTDGVTIHKRTFRPHIAGAVYSGAFTSFQNLTGAWIDCASPNVKHYGMKTAWSVTTNPYVYDFIVRAWIQFRNTR